MPITPSHNQAQEVTAARVAAGVAWLDLHQPGWRERGDLDRLDMSCGTYPPAEHGFTDDAAAWPVLTADWREALRPADKERATADPVLESPLEGVGFDV